MLRPYINDVIGKIAVINQYLLGQGSSSQMQGIIKSYQSLPFTLFFQTVSKETPLIALINKFTFLKA